MAKLAAKDRKKAEKAQAVSGEFKPLPAGKYIAELLEVETKVSAAGNAYWNASFNEIHNMQGEKQPGRQFFRLMLPIDKMPADYKEDTGLSDAEKAEKWEVYQSLTAGRIKAFFEAFGYSLDSDTDEMIGDRCILQVGVRTINQGDRTGQLTNEVFAVLPLGDADVPFGDDDNDADHF